VPARRGLARSTARPAPAPPVLRLAVIDPTAAQVIQIRCELCAAHDVIRRQRRQLWGWPPR